MINVNVLKWNVSLCNHCEYITEKCINLWSLWMYYEEMYHFIIVIVLKRNVSLCDYLNISWRNSSLCDYIIKKCIILWSFWIYYEEIYHFVITANVWRTAVCPIRYRTPHFFNNSNINEYIAKKFEQEYVRCVRNFFNNEVSPLQISLQYPH